MVPGLVSEPIIVDLEDPNCKKLTLTEAFPTDDSPGADDDNDEVWALYDAPDEFDLENCHQLTNALEFEVEEDDRVNIDVPLLWDLLNSELVAGVVRGTIKKVYKVFVVKDDITF
jgi:hypothetical protein